MRGIWNSKSFHLHTLEKKKIEFDFILKFTHVTSAIPYSFDVCIEPITITYTFLSPSVLFLQLNFKSKRHKGTDNEIDFIPYSSF